MDEPANAAVPGAEIFGSVLPRQIFTIWLTVVRFEQNFQNTTGNGLSNETCLCMCQ